MIEKLLCVLIIAALWLLSFGAVCSAGESAKNAVDAYKDRIEQEADEE